jgi:mono/diheme cytochrome c family protein
MFRRQIKPLLQANCLACHSGDKPMGGLSLTSRAGLLKGGSRGAAVDVRQPGGSLLLKAVRHEASYKMPPAGKLPQKDIDAFARWIAAGAPWDAEEVKPHGPPQVDAAAKRFWSFVPVKRVTPPVLKDSAWVRSPVDAFVLSTLRKNGLKPNPTASRLQLIRRATYDLTGLPPTEEEVAAFLADRSPNAWEKVVDRLLASPQYGVKWGRHWLDLVRFSETNSYERDGHKPEAWRYRDYVINSLNADKPFNEFAMEQLAGDEMAERTPERLIATGYYRLGLWDDEPADPKQALYDDLDDILSTTGQVFLGLTVGCARCHDHKIDPMPQKDYYRLLAFFQGVKRFGVRSYESVVENSLRPISPPEEVARHDAEVKAHREKVDANNRAIFALERKVFADLAPVEREEFRDESARADILKKRIGRLITEEEHRTYLALTAERRRLREYRPRALEMVLCVTEEPKPRRTAVLMRGNPHVEGEEVSPGFLSVTGAPDPVVAPSPQPGTSGRRTAFAKWVVDPANPLTARVLANRVWQYHFGRGIVRTPSNFGYGGLKPTHPELLDWLAGELVRGGWRLKPLHRMLMLSNTYKMSSAGNAAALAKDPENDLMWRFDPRRLQAEEVRDSILAANNSLNLKMGGPSMYPTIPAAVLAGQSRPGEGWGRSSKEEQARRSIYIYSKRSLPAPIIASFDGPETDFTCPVRFSTTQPTQALGMMNSEFVNEQAAVFAAYVRSRAGNVATEQVKVAIQRVTQRPATEAEINRGILLMLDLQSKRKMSAEEALKSLCVVMLNLNEFLYLD